VLVFILHLNKVRARPLRLYLLVRASYLVRLLGIVIEGNIDIGAPTVKPLDRDLVATVFLSILSSSF